MALVRLICFLLVYIRGLSCRNSVELPNNEAKAMSGLIFSSKWFRGKYYSCFGEKFYIKKALDWIISLIFPRWNCETNWVYHSEAVYYHWGLSSGVVVRLLDWRSRSCRSKPVHWELQTVVDSLLYQRPVLLPLWSVVSKWTTTLEKCRAFYLVISDLVRITTFDLHC